MRGNILPFEEWTPEIAPDAFIAPDATVIGQVEIGARSSIWYKCVLRGDIERIVIGKNVNIQDGSVVHVTDNLFSTTIGDDSSVGHMALLHGCTLEPRAFVAMRAVVMDGAVIESGAILAAGAVLTPGKRIPSGELWAGAPAKFMRKLTEQDEALFDYITNSYLRLSQRHKTTLEKQFAAAAD